MPIFEIQGPDGATYEIDAPDEASALKGFQGFASPPAPRSGKHLSFEEGQALLDADERANSASGALGAGLTGLVDGVPIAGPMILGATQRAAAGLTSAIDGGSYEDRLKQAQDITSRAQDAHPYITTGANITGAVGGMLPAAMAAPAAFGGGPGSLLLRSLYSTITGGGIGAADSAVRSEGDPKAIQNGAMWGAGTGFIGPAVGKAVGAGANKLLEMFRGGQAAKAAGTTRYAVNKLREAFDADNLDVPTAQGRLSDLGPEGMVADIGDNIRGRTAALANMSGEGNAVVRDALEARRAGANSRIRTSVDENLGRNIVPSDVIDDIAANQQALSPAYEEAFRGVRPYDISPVADDLDRSISRLRGPAQRKLQQVRGMLNVDGADALSSNPRVHFETRQAIDGMLATEADPKVIRALSEARQMIDDSLADAVPGLKEIDGRYAELARQRDAIGRGQQVLDSGRTAPRPSELAAEVEAGAQPQPFHVGPSAVPLRLSQGARAEVDRILGTNANDVQRLNRLIKTEGDWNRDRLATLFGQEKADRLFKVLENELAFARTREFVTGNSATAGRQQHIEALGGSPDPAIIRQAYAAGGVPGAVRGAGLKTADKLFRTIMDGRTQEKNKALADLLVSNRPEVLQLMSPNGLSPNRQRLIEQMTQSILLGAGTARAR
ncbi:hypothetical protein P7F60_12015 [Rhizobium sp. YJ-22]|uniref:hypothetical protein n=1 Tax=Rhizobium sp. YJ-22 TaxID=3037556 RepID=UPI0024122F16|nr:hypothetical protein [Rhizobium sp. YJ-22]MDG3577118.1 hypothetical protein [Rhizobium sp. YJ-22]